MALEDANMAMRGRKEIVNGKTVDQQGVHLDESALESALFRVASGKSADYNSDNSADIGNLKLSANAQNIDGKIVDEDGIHLSKDDLLASLLPNIKIDSKSNVSKSKKQHTNDYGIYQPIIDEIAKIPLSENYKVEIQEIVKEIKDLAMKYKLKKIISNTKAIAKNAEKFYYTNDSVRIVFSILGNKFSVSARGEFSGHEAINLRVDGDNLAAEVYRLSDEGDVDEVTHNFKIGIQKV